MIIRDFELHMKKEIIFSSTLLTISLPKVWYMKDVIYKKASQELEFPAFWAEYFHDTHIHVNVYVCVCIRIYLKFLTW